MRDLRRWWDADTGGWPTAITLTALLVIFALVILL